MAQRDINSIMAGWVDRGPWQYWDTVRGTAGVAMLNSYSPFSIPIGQVDPITTTAKTMLDTNMQRGNQFPPPRCLIIMQLGFYFASNMLKADIDNILNGCYVEVKIDDKVYMQGQLWQFPAGVGLSGVTTNTTEAVWTNGFPSLEATRRYGEYSKYIAPLQQFSMTITFPGTPPTLTAANAGGTGLRLIPFFDGLTDRSVQ